MATGEGEAAGAAGLDALFARATAAHAANHVERALESYLTILECDPEHIATLIHVADVYLRFGREADARLLLAHVAGRGREAVLANVRGLASANLAFVGLCRRAGEAELADRILARALGLWPNDPALNEAVGQRLAEDGNADGAEAYLHHALAMAPERIAIRFKLAEVRLARGDAPAGVEALLEILEVEPGHGEAIRRAIAAAEALHDADLRATLLRRLAERIEGDREALAYIGFKLLAEERFEGALAAFARASDLDLDSHETLIGAGAAAHALDEEKAAEEYWRQGLAAIPDHAEAWLAAAQTFAHDLPRPLLRQLVDGAARHAGKAAESLCAVAEVACELSLHEAGGEIARRALALEPRNARARRLLDSLARFHKD